MIIPYGTDAPIYHYPFATGGLIALNVGLFAATMANPEPFLDWMLILGDGVHPLQWVSHAFLHAGIMHLVGNMIFLWAFGIIVEGKTGPFGFVAIYLALAAASGAVDQLLMLGLEEPKPALGASGVIFGLMVMCLVWAPKNRVTCFVMFGAWFRYYVGTWEIPIVAFAAMEIGWEVVELFLRHMIGASLLSSAFLHVTGALAGAALGVWMVKANLVDCEGWDVFAVMAGTAGRSGAKGPSALKTKKTAKSAALREKMEAASKTKSRGKARVVEMEGPAVAVAESRRTTALERLIEKLDGGDIDSALRIYDKTARTIPGWPGETESLDLIKRFHARGAVVESTPIMRDYCKNYPDSADRVRLKLAQIYIRDRQLPTRGLRVLEEIDPGSLPPNLESIRAALERQARGMVEEGVLELEGDD